MTSRKDKLDVLADLILGAMSAEEKGKLRADLEELQALLSKPKVRELLASKAFRENSTKMKPGDILFIARQAAAGAKITCGNGRITFDHSPCDDRAMTLLFPPGQPKFSTNISQTLGNEE